MYYPDMWSEIRFYLLNLEKRFDLYITTPYEVNISEGEIRKEFPDAYIYHCENRGRDVAPFLTMFSVISKLDYKYACKIHTKKSPHIINGHEWHQDMLIKLLGSQEIILRVKEAFDSHPDWGLIAPSGHVVPSGYFWNQNVKNVTRLAHSVNISTDDIEFSFVAGSMFWFKPQALQLLLKLDVLATDFDNENGQQDGTLAHAFERFFGIALNHTGYKIAESDMQEIRLAEVSFQFRLLLQEFQRQESLIQTLTTQVSRNERRLRKLFGGKFWQIIKVFRRIRSLKDLL